MASPKDLVLSSVGAALAIAALGYLAQATRTPLIMAPLAASALLVFVVPDNALAQPRNVIGGHVLSGAIGIGIDQALGTPVWVMAVAVGLAIAAMQATRTVHAPAATLPVLIMMSGEPRWSFLITPVLAGSIILVGCGVVFHRLIARRRYPASWF